MKHVSAWAAPFVDAEYEDVTSSWESREVEAWREMQRDEARKWSIRSRTCWALCAVLFLAAFTPHVPWHAAEFFFACLSGGGALVAWQQAHIYKYGSRITIE